MESVNSVVYASVVCNEHLLFLCSLVFDCDLVCYVVCALLCLLCCACDCMFTLVLVALWFRLAFVSVCGLFAVVGLF